MNVFKFGGASVKNAPGFVNVAEIIAFFKGEKLAIVVSATGKTTNALETVVKSYFYKDGTALEKLDAIKRNHYEIIETLGLVGTEIEQDVNDLFVEIDWILDDEPHDQYDYIYDQIVSIGELVSSRILYHTLRSRGINASWLDVRGVLFTDEIHREAKVIWNLTSEKVNASIRSLLEHSDVVVTQGFIGSTTENHTTTLGREGSDYTAAILSYCCNAEAMHIWKDVPGVLTGDPRKFENVVKMEKLSYKEAIEMTYYGAKVIHPKTIKPLQNKNIPLYVRPFDNPSSVGTKISSEAEGFYPPIVVIEEDQALVSISVRDFSFVAEQHISNIFGILSELRLKVNMMRNTAISFTLCVQHHQDKLLQLKEKLENEFSVNIETGLEMITIRHFTKEAIQEMKRNKLTLFEDRLQDTIQLVVKEIPLITRKKEDEK
ncbi:MAG: aspartate kinase [Saprospiraceae bacterium]|nr:aspartate kinase [Saprospiraceae bacterium]